MKEYQQTHDIPQLCDEVWDAHNEVVDDHEEVLGQHDMDHDHEDHRQG